MAPQVLELLTLEQYGTERVHLFPSKTSMTWFLRKHKQGLVAKELC